MTRKVKVRILTFKLALFTQNNIEEAIQDFNPLSIIAINTLYIPPTIKKIPIPMPITGEGNGDNHTCRIEGNPYIKVIVWYWEEE